MPELKNAKISELSISSDHRTDLGDMEELQESISLKGVLQPIAITSDGRVLAGRRRFRACKTLGMEEIPALVIYPEDDLDELEIELIENAHRKDMTWQEVCKIQKTIHNKYVERYGRDWSVRKTAKLIQKSMGNVSENLQLADFIDTVPLIAQQKDRKSALKLIKGAHKQVQTKESVERYEKELAQSFRDNLLEDQNGDEISDEDKISLREAFEIAERRGESATDGGDEDGIDRPKLDFSTEDSRKLYFAAKRDYQVGDAFEGMDKMIEGFEKTPSTISLIEVDPPYGIELHAKKRGDNSVSKKDYHEVDPAEYVRWLNNLCSKLYRIGARNCWCLFWFGPTWHAEVRTALKLGGFTVDDIPAIWSKGSGQTNSPDIYLARSYEPFFIARKGDPKLCRPGTNNVFSFNPVSATRKIHPTQRPVELMESILTTFVQPGSVICSPFLGSGSTLRAALANKMKCTGWDLSENHKMAFLNEVQSDIEIGAYDG